MCIHALLNWEDKWVIIGNARGYRFRYPLFSSEKEYFRERERLIKFRKLKHHLLKVVFDCRECPSENVQRSLSELCAHADCRDIPQTRENRMAIFYSRREIATERERERGPADLDDGQSAGQKTVGTSKNRLVCGSSFIFFFFFLLPPPSR